MMWVAFGADLRTLRVETFGGGFTRLAPLNIPSLRQCSMDLLLTPKHLQHLDLLDWLLTGQLTSRTFHGNLSEPITSSFNRWQT